MILRVMLFFVVCGLIWFVYTQWIIHNKSSDRELSRADVGIVLGATLWDNKPSPALAERLDYALSLYQAGHFDNFIVTGGLDHPSLRLTEAQGMAAYLIERGVSSDRILLENEATSTYENLLFSRQIMTEHGYHSAVIITHRYHGARSLEIANFLAYDNPIVATTESKVLNMAWHQMRESLAYTKWKLEQFWITIGMKG